ncbi:hypothetical protein AK88_04826 [Plasmodium fragile]|uniref:Uncharacterized protein n=1 Tax=Plasmodium fragile TaxID=5857 RepID=A0A0D9QET2_PLAFR|nr:uncharacterized protein AK88_04826 [Plasmodium fragile]KJP85560.1 hypothetical protein AK88_04826 [Plasmodium fragile]
MEESKHGTEYASETSCNQELLMDNILYTFQYRLWKDYNWCSRHARKGAVRVPIIPVRPVETRANTQNRSFSRNCTATLPLHR